jgi:hypothetical protein
LVGGVRPNIREIIAATAGQYAIPVESMFKAKRRAIAHPRQVAMYLSRLMAGNSLPVIGRAFDRDHTTVIYAMKAVEARCADETDLVAIILAIASEATRLARAREDRERAHAVDLHIAAAMIPLPPAPARRLPKSPVPHPMPGARWTLTLFDRRAA